MIKLIKLLCNIIGHKLIEIPEKAQIYRYVIPCSTGFKERLEVDKFYICKRCRTEFSSNRPGYHKGPYGIMTKKD